MNNTHESSFCLVAVNGDMSNNGMSDTASVVIFNHEYREIVTKFLIAQIILYSVSLRLNSITARRAFRGMAGLAVLYPSVVDYIGWSLKTLSASSTGL